MFINYFKTTFRNLMKNKTFSFINVAGLSLGLAACLLILQYVSFELSFDRFNKNAADIYRVVNDRYQNGKLIQHGTITYSAIGKAMEDDFPEVVNHARVEPTGTTIITFNNKKIGEQNGLAVDNSFLSMFSYPVVAGDAKTPLTQPNQVILSETLARKIFGVRAGDFETAIGKTIRIETDSMPYKITAICKDVPENSHLKFDFLASYSTLYSGEHDWKQANYDFTDSDFWHYIQLKHGTDYKALESKFPAFSQRHFQGDKVSGSVEKFYLQPLLKAHLYSDFEYEIGNTGSAIVVWGLLIIALLIIVIAWINYINLTTAKSMERAREVGLRKVVGATKRQLIWQFLAESFMMNMIALLLALCIVFLVQQGFNNLVKHHLSLAYLVQKGLSGYNIIAGLILLVCAGVIISGFYPAIVLSSFKPILVLKGKYITSFRGIFFRKSLVVGQFAVTVALIIGSLVVYRQLRYMNNQSLGFNLSQVMVIKPPELTRWDSTFIPRENSLQAELKQIPHVLGVANSWNVPGHELGRNFGFRRTDAPASVHYATRFLGVSPEFIPLYHIKLLAGRQFVSTDYNYIYGKLHNIIISKSAAKLIGFPSPEQALGRSVTLLGKQWDVVGVIADFHQKSLRYAEEPIVFIPAYGTQSPISVKVDTRDLPTTIAAIRKEYSLFFPGNLFDYYFLDERFNQQYSDVQLFGRVFGIFAGFAIFIACLGLFGLSLFTTSQRIKEIGIRKVLGASVSGIIVMLSKDFIKLILFALVIAFPLAGLIMHKWLQGFAYKMNMSWWIFLFAGLLATLIALITVSWQAVRAAMANPVESLRTE